MNPRISSISLYFLIKFTPCVSPTNLHPYCRPSVCLVQHTTPSTPLPPRPPLLPPAFVFGNSANSRKKHHAQKPLDNFILINCLSLCLSRALALNLTARVLFLSSCLPRSGSASLCFCFLPPSPPPPLNDLARPPPLPRPLVCNRQPPSNCCLLASATSPTASLPAPVLSLPLIPIFCNAACE